MTQENLRFGFLSIGVALFALAGAAAQNESTGAAAAAAAPKSSRKLEYNRDVRPILSENCFACHGPDKKTRKGGLRLDDRDAALAKKVFVPGKADESELVKRVFSNDPDEVMPPADHRKKLTAQQREILKRWVNEGAPYQPHWAYIPVKRPAVPEVADSAAWARNPIDRFILAELEAHKIKPSREADRRTLIRRVSLDLIGIPPTPAEVDAFLLDNRPDAYERLVDRLLASPHYGERMAVPWLDVVRFADTVGYHGDQNQRIFPYRDYVINAFNSNKPFDQFTIEQLAGDLLPNPTKEQLVATGFNRLNMMTREGGAQPKEYLAKYQADRVRTVSMAWLGSTMGCCECHDH
jgi:mono/diheme cytochrome c family protein